MFALYRVTPVRGSKVVLALVTVVVERVESKKQTCV